MQEPGLAVPWQHTYIEYEFQQSYLKVIELFLVVSNSLIGLFFPNNNQDFEAFNHCFEFTKADSSHLLLPQRRERVWGSSCIGGDKSKYQFAMQMTMQRMKSSKRFALSQILDNDLPSEDQPTSDVFGKHFVTVRKLCKEKNIDFNLATMDSSTSRSRDPEWAHNMLTCVRPSHRVWLCGQRRFATAAETLRAHGIFPELFPNPSALTNMDPSLALDMSGNAFSTTALIAKILCSMVNAYAWLALANSSPIPRAGVLKECMAQSQKRSRPSHGAEPGPSAQDQVEEPPKKKQRTRKTGKPSKKRKTEGNPEDGGDPPMQPAVDKNSQGRGFNMKGFLLTISKKLAILDQFEELKKVSQRPEKEIGGQNVVVVFFNAYQLH